MVQVSLHTEPRQILPASSEMYTLLKLGGHRYLIGTLSWGFGIGIWREKDVLLHPWARDRLRGLSVNIQCIWCIIENTVDAVKLVFLPGHCGLSYTWLSIWNTSQDKTTDSHSHSSRVAPHICQIGPGVEWEQVWLNPLQCIRCIKICSYFTWLCSLHTQLHCFGSTHMAVVIY